MRQRARTCKKAGVVLHAGTPGSELVYRDTPGKTGMVGRYAMDKNVEHM